MEAAATTETKTVFLVHGWNEGVLREISQLLALAKHHVFSWDDGMHGQEGDAPPTTWRNLHDGIQGANKVVVLYTPDEQAISNIPGRPLEELRPRPNVLYELGLAHAWRGSNTILVTFGLTPPSDLDSVHRVEWSADPSARMSLLKAIEGRAHPWDENILGLNMNHCDALVSGSPPADPSDALHAEAHAAGQGASERPTSTPAMRFPWSDPIDAIVVDGKLRLIVPDGRAVRSIDPVSGEVVSRCEIGAPIDEVEITHDGLFVCARAGNRVFVAGLDVRGRLIPAWKPLALPDRRDWQLLTAEGRGPSAVRLVVADGSQTLVKEVRPDTSHDIEFPTDALRAAAVGPSGFLTLPGGDAPPAERAPWQLVDSASKGKVALTVWAAGPHVLLERRSSRGAMTRDLGLPGDARQVAVARQRKGEPELVLAHVGDELLVWRWGDLEADTS